MPSYFVSLCNGHGLDPDDGGGTFSGLAAALEEAEAIARDVARLLIAQNRPLTGVVEVRDDEGTLVFSFPVAQALPPRNN
jgi:hypothetical protein